VAEAKYCMPNSTLDFRLLHLFHADAWASRIISLLPRFTHKMLFTCETLILRSTQLSTLYALFFTLAKHPSAQYTQLIDIAVSDRPTNPLRFKIRYLLLSPRAFSRVIITASAAEFTTIPSLTNLKHSSAVTTRTSLFASAGWLEREVGDMYGIYFAQHNDFRRLLTDYGFQGYPLRKEFPLSGFIEVFYSDAEARIIYVPVELMQEFRNFAF
jgi:NADH:ubiquinone oxidoreductase subunit C